ncbi:uncharacterized protein HaLaN_25638, partial [Haematococcus lacustris]
MKAFATRQRWPQQAWAYDGQKILYTHKAFIPPTGSVDTVDILDEGPGVAAGDAARKPAGAKSTPTTYEIQVNHRANGKLRHRVRGFTPQSAAKGLFEMKDGTKTTVVKYFKQAYNMTLTYPNLPCVIVGSRSRPEWLPIEVCRIVPDSAAKGLFEMKDGTKTTVVKYFKQAYNMTLTYPNLPCVIVGSRSRPEWLPIEVCRIVPDSGQPQP